MSLLLTSSVATSSSPSSSSSLSLAMIRANWCLLRRQSLMRRSRSCEDSGQMVMVKWSVFKWLNGKGHVVKWLGEHEIRYGYGRAYSRMESVILNGSELHLPPTTTPHPVRFLRQTISSRLENMAHQVSQRVDASRGCIDSQRWRSY